MFISIFIFFIALIIPIILISVVLLVSFHSFKDREKTSPFECGFDPLATARLPFSMRFFLLAVIFLVFDIEIVLLMPLVLITYSHSIIFSSILFISILLLGLLHEWREGSLNWT